jgi:DNA replication protein DnaC
MPNLLSDEERDKRAAEYDKRLAQKRREQAIEHCRANSGLPQRHMVAHIDDDGPWSAASNAAWEAVQAGNSVLLLGPRGTGKTQIATLCGIRMASNARSVRYLKASDLFRQCREAMHDKGESDQISRFIRVSLLIVDEAHVRVDSDFEDRILTEIVDSRYDAYRPTILITNQSKERAAKSLGPSIVSRFHESGMVLECNWDSFRDRGRL